MTRASGIASDPATRTRWLGVGMLVLALSACGGEAETSTPVDDPAAVDPATPADTAPADEPEPVPSAVEQELVEPVAFERLVVLLPEIDGWSRSDYRGERNDDPVQASRAEARYTQDGSEVIVTIVDTGMSQILLAPYTMFLASGFEERTDDAVIRSLDLHGSPGFERWVAADRRGEVVVVVANRFVVTATGTGVRNLNPVKRVLGRISLSRLAGIR